MVTINNPLEHGFDHDSIVSIMSKVKGSSLYWCMCDEEGDECETLHTHIFIFRASAFPAEQIGKLFPKCHRDKCYGTCAENRAYVLKDGAKFNKDENGHYDYVDKTGKQHIGVNHSETFFEHGDCPEEHQGRSTASELIVDLIRDGVGNRAIVEMVPAAYKELDKIERSRSMFRDADFASSWRDLHVEYHFGTTGTGKTRTVMEQYGYINCYRVTDYKHPFDTYDGQDVLIFEEFRGGLKHGDMLNYLDGYPLLLPCRYFNRQACFTKVFILTNIPPDAQYPNIDAESRNAFFRRIHKVVQYGPDGKKREWPHVQAYLCRDDWVSQAQAADDCGQIEFSENLL